MLILNQLLTNVSMEDSRYSLSVECFFYLYTTSEVYTNFRIDSVNLIEFFNFNSEINCAA